ncbi:MAG TPA: aquaporin [Terriglobales bacterium]|nr:aquaporin [Terriglobales bacterium]
MSGLVSNEAIRNATAGSTTARCEFVSLNAIESLRSHWPEYLMEAGELAFFMFSVCTFATLLQHPASPVRQFIPSVIGRRALMGLAVGLTVVAIIITPWGKQSGGHFNPAITLTFYSLGKVAFWDAVFYVTAQFVGAAAGVAIAGVVLRGAPQTQVVRYAVTVPGILGNTGALAGEITISFVLMTVILFATNRETLARYTPFLVGVLYATFITFESPLSGMSMNPARTFGSAFRSGYWQAIWIYFIAPTIGMLIAGEIFLWLRNGVAPYCAKLHHANNKRCIFRHGTPPERLKPEHTLQSYHNNSENRQRISETEKIK